MNSDLELYRANVRRFVETEIKPNQQKWAKQQHVDRELWFKAGEMGVLSADVPEEYGHPCRECARNNVCLARSHHGPSTRE